MRALFWIAAALLAWAQVGYGLFLAALRRVAGPTPQQPPPAVRPRMSLIVAAYREVRQSYLKGRNLPASTLVGVTGLVDPDLMLEVEVVAAPS